MHLRVWQGQHGAHPGLVCVGLVNAEKGDEALLGLCQIVVNDHAPEEVSDIFWVQAPRHRLWDRLQEVLVGLELTAC